MRIMLLGHEYLMRAWVSDHYHHTMGPIILAQSIRLRLMQFNASVLHEFAPDTISIFLIGQGQGGRYERGLFLKWIPKVARY